jgi:hypothetical protein
MYLIFMYLILTSLLHRHPLLFAQACWSTQHHGHTLLDRRQLHSCVSYRHGSKSRVDMRLIDRRAATVVGFAVAALAVVTAPSA